MIGDQQQGQIIFQTTQGNLSFSRLETSAHCSLCGINAISNYVKFLPESKRLECYRKLLELTWAKHSDYANPFTTLTPKLKLKLLFLEEFFKKREESASSYIDHTSPNDDQAIKTKALSENHQELTLKLIKFFLRKEIILITKDKHWWIYYLIEIQMIVK